MEYRVEAKVTIGTWTVVKAESKEEAIRIAEEREDKMSFINNSGMDENDAWIIETKFECPSINMAHMDTASLGAAIGDGREKYYTRGIWKGYGQHPTGSEGMFLQLKESYPQVINDYKKAGASDLTGSLIDVCGFKASKERVGEIRSKKKYSLYISK